MNLLPTFKHIVMDGKLGFIVRSSDFFNKKTRKWDSLIMSFVHYKTTSCIISSISQSKIVYQGKTSKFEKPQGFVLLFQN
jgi:hypothetical protein